MAEILINEKSNVWCKPITEEDVEYIRKCRQIIKDIDDNRSIKEKEKAKEPIYDGFKRKLGIKYKSIIVFGSTENKPDRKFLNKIIPVDDKGRKNENNHSVYKCFVIDHVSTVVLHEDMGSSWNCLMTKINKPKCLIVYYKENEN